MKMFRLGKIVPIFMSKADQTGGPVTLNNNIPMCGCVDLQGNVWVNVAASAGPGLFGSLTVAPDNADGVAVSATPTDLLTISRMTIFNGATWDRLRAISAAVLSAFSSVGGLLVSTPGQWAAFQTPAAATQATCNRVAAAGVSHVCNSIAATINGTAAQPALILVLRDGATGAGAIIWSLRLGPVVIGDSKEFFLSGLNIVGTAGNAMCLEFTTAPAATNFESVAMTGFDAT